MDILSKSQTPSPPQVAERMTSQSKQRNGRESRRSLDAGRRSLLNSWNEGIRLDDSNNFSDRIHVAIEGLAISNCFPVTKSRISDKIKSEIQKAYEVYHGEKVGDGIRSNSMRKDSVTDETEALIDGTIGRKANHRTGSSSSATANADLPDHGFGHNAQQKLPADASDSENTDVVNGSNMPHKDLILHKT